MARSGRDVYKRQFLAYVQDETKITFPWSMIDKITPRPDAKVQQMLADDGFEDNYTIVDVYKRQAWCQRLPCSAR